MAELSVLPCCTPGPPTSCVRQLNALEKNYSRLQALPSAIPEFGRLRNEVQEGCESVSWQVRLRRGKW